jgi:hypothetical protein
MDNVVKAINFFRERVLNHREFVPLLGEIGSKHGEIIYKTNEKLLNSGLFQQMLLFIY